MELCSVIGAFPGSWLSGFGHDLHPLFGVPIEHIECVESALVRSPAPEDNNTLIY
jgi:hypothetical protein